MKLDRLTHTLKGIAGKRAGLCARVFTKTIDGRDGERIFEGDCGDLSKETNRVQLATEILEQVQADADEAGLRREYSLVLVDAKEEPIGRASMRQDPSPEALEERRANRANAPPEEASVSAMVRQALQHTERTMELMLASQEANSRSLIRMIDRLSEENDKLREREVHTFETIRHAALAEAHELRAEKTGELMDRGMDLVGRVLAGAGIQLGFLPPGFDFDGDLTKLQPFQLGAANDNNGASGAANDNADDPADDQKTGDGQAAE